jgi:hypothetical protein
VASAQADTNDAVQMLADIVGESVEDVRSYALETFFDEGVVGNAIDILNGDDADEVNDDEGIVLVQPQNLASLD